MTFQTFDLSTAHFMGASSGGPFGQFGDSVIYGGGGGGVGFPDFWFDGALDPAQTYTVEITFDPASLHDSGGRLFLLTGVRPGFEEDAETVGGFPIGDLHDGSASVVDVASVTIGPGVNGWDDATFGVPAGFTHLFFETDTNGAVSQIRIEPPLAAETAASASVSTLPPLRIHPRSDGLGTSAARRIYPPPRSRQGSNRPTGYL